MNYTDMESKVCLSAKQNLNAAQLIHTQVREATNNEPWGASSTLMQEIASGTFS